MLRPEHFRNLQEEYTISKAQYLEHQILLDEIEGREANDITQIRKQNKADVGLELSNSEIANNMRLIKDHVAKAHKLGYGSPFDVILQLDDYRFRIIAVLEMFYKLEIRAVHRMNDGTFLLLSTHGEMKICDIKNYPMKRAINVMVDEETGSYVVNRKRYEKSIKSACYYRRETNRASVGFIFHEHKPNLEELNYILNCLEKRSKAEYVSFSGGIPFDEEEITLEELIDEEHPNYHPEYPFVPEFKEPVTSTPLDADNEIPF